ncbi:hypothetical protein QUF86_01605 [Peribacillus sp. NJ11]|uniref:hypothetical protein n=1 Tax=Peribacillus sp. NJ11 TaxID=3055861 RepID=UPI0025A2415C|nr:hypothetical protein [Peribacillus sp. NJ11]MDM5219529.1 hypothetical protein [Peribacillus sp. NJ11]
MFGNFKELMIQQILSNCEEVGLPHYVALQMKHYQPQLSARFSLLSFVCLDASIVDAVVSIGKVHYFLAGWRYRFLVNSSLFPWLFLLSIKCEIHMKAYAIISV